MAKLKMPSDAAKSLTVPERLLLLCVAAEIDFKHAKVAERVATEVVVKGLIERDAAGHLALTDRGRAVLRRCCRTYDGLIGLYPNNRIPACVGLDGIWAETRQRRGPLDDRGNPPQISRCRVWTLVGA